MSRRDKTDMPRTQSTLNRRAQQGEKRALPNTYSVQSHLPNRNAPVFSRMAVMSTPVLRRTRTQVKRKITLPLRGGAELEIPGIPILRPGWRLLSGFLAINLTVFLILIMMTPILHVGAITVAGLQRVNATDLAAVLKLDNEAIFLIDPAEAEVQLAEAFPELTDIQVTIQLPTTVEIQVRERQPVLAWQYESLTLWADMEGSLFPARGDGGELFLITGKNALPRLHPVEEMGKENPKNETNENTPTDQVYHQGLVDPLFIASILDLHQLMPEITQLSFNEKDGFGWHDPNLDWNVYFGHTLDNLEQKILVYQAMAAMFTEKGIHPNKISVAYLRAPYFRLEQ